MTRNDTPDKLKWSIRPRLGVDSAQWDWGIIKEKCLTHVNITICDYVITDEIEDTENSV